MRTERGTDRTEIEIEKQKPINIEKRNRETKITQREKERKKGRESRRKQNLRKLTDCGKRAS